MDKGLLATFQDYLAHLGLYQYNHYKSMIAAATPGADSVALCQLLHQTGNLKGIAHCNYGLRDSSDSDEWFVQRMAERLGVPFYTKKFNTRAYAEHWGISQQVAARQLRFAYLNGLSIKNKVEKVATAFNGSEALELLFINMAKGSGLPELSKPLPMQYRMVRPLMCASKEEILQFVAEERLDHWPDYQEFQEDALHAKVREQVLPAMEALNPNFQAGLRETLERWQSAAQLMQSGLGLLYARWNGRNGVLEYTAYDYGDNPVGTEKLYHLLKDYGFSYEQAGKLTAARAKSHGWGNTAGSCLSSTHRVEISSSYLSLYRRDHTEIEVPSPDDAPVQLSNGLLDFNLVKNEFQENYVTKMHLHLDPTKLTWPLRLRRWRPNDLFHAASSYTRPQTLHTYFNNRKIAGRDRDDCWVIWSGDNICAVAGMEADVRFLPPKDSDNLLAISYYLHVDARLEY